MTNDIKEVRRALKKLVDRFNNVYCKKHMCADCPFRNKTIYCLTYGLSAVEYDLIGIARDLKKKK